jgi:hypothetical protein
LSLNELFDGSRDVLPVEQAADPLVQRVPQWLFLEVDFG